MLSETQKTYSILTGDLIDSRKLTAEKVNGTLDAMDHFWSKYARLIEPAGVLSGVEVFRGDGWQVAIASPEYSIDAAVFLRAVVKACPLSDKSDSRVGIGIGQADHLDSKHLGASHGKAFEASGDALASLNDKKLRWCLLPDKAPYRWLNTLLLPSLDLAISRWSSVEALAVLGEMLGWTQEETASHPWAEKKDGNSPSPQSIGKAFRRTLWKSHIYPSLSASRQFLEAKNNL